MSVEVRPLGVKCNIQCSYCYQDPQREAGNVFHRVADGRLKDSIEKAVLETRSSSFTLFGGEPLLTPIEMLEDLWSWGFSKYGVNQVQTNGTLVTGKHIELFKKYNVSVGISIDGPGVLNLARWHNDYKRTLASTEKVQRNIERLCREHRPPGLIVTLSRCNAAPDKLPMLEEWFRLLDGLGVRSVGLHELECDSDEVRKGYALSMDENIAAFLTLYRLEKTLPRLRFSLFRDMKSLLLGDDRNVTCVWRACDPLTTSAVRGVEGDGSISNCGRTNKEGVSFVKAKTPAYERYIALHETPQAEGGCQGCRFFLMCKGQCPGTAIRGDWRNRTEYCDLWMALFSFLERELVEEGRAPISTSPLRSEIERRVLGHWQEGRNPLLADVAEEVIEEHQGQEPHEPSPAQARPAKPEFMRIAWSSDEARAVWQPRIDRISQAWRHIERQSVSAGIRECTLAEVQASDLPEYAGRCSQDGLMCVPLSMTSASSGFRNRTQAPTYGEAFRYRIVTGKPPAASAFVEAWNRRDDEKIGSLLGYPSCCCGFFKKVWAERRLTDTTWPMVCGEEDSGTEGIRTATMRPETNILCRWLGVRAVSHLPCRPDCGPSIELGRKLLALGEELGYRDEVNWALEILSWPVHWSRRNGIAIILLPVVKIVATSDEVPGVQECRFESDCYPVEGGSGIRFPYTRHPSGEHLRKIRKKTARKMSDPLRGPLELA